MRLDDFLNCFFDDDETMHFRGISPKALDKKLPVYEKKLTRRQLRENKLLQGNLIHANKTHGLYFVVNSGGFLIPEIKKLNACFCEMDDRPLIEQHDAYDLAPLSPSLRIETRKSVHAYYLLNEPITADQWGLIQQGMIAHFKSDAGIKNTNRLMRLPFFNHVHWADAYEFKKVTMHTFCPEFRYGFQELREAFPFTKPIPPKPRFTDEFDGETMEGIAQELRYRISMLPTYRVEHDRVHATAQGTCHNGEGNTALMVNLRTGAVFCHSGCDFWRIADSFGLSRPVKYAAPQPKFRPRVPQTSATGRMLTEYVNGNV